MKCSYRVRDYHMCSSLFEHAVSIYVTCIVHRELLSCTGTVPFLKRNCTEDVQGLFSSK